MAHTARGFVHRTVGNIFNDNSSFCLNSPDSAANQAYFFPHEVAVKHKFELGFVWMFPGGSFSFATGKQLRAFQGKNIPLNWKAALQFTVSGQNLFTRLRKKYITDPARQVPSISFRGYTGLPFPGNNLLDVCNYSVVDSGPFDFVGALKDRTFTPFQFSASSFALAFALQWARYGGKFSLLMVVKQQHPRYAWPYDDAQLESDMPPGTTFTMLRCLALPVPDPNPQKPNNTLQLPVLLAAETSSGVPENLDEIKAELEAELQRQASGCSLPMCGGHCIPKSPYVFNVREPLAHFYEPNAKCDRSTQSLHVAPPPKHLEGLA